MSCPSQQPALPSENTYSGCASRRIRVSPRRSMWTRYDICPYAPIWSALPACRTLSNIQQARGWRCGGSFDHGRPPMDATPFPSSPLANGIYIAVFSSSLAFLPCFTGHDSTIAPFPSFALNDEVKLGRTLGVSLSFSWFEIVLKFDWFVGCLYMTIIFSFVKLNV